MSVGKQLADLDSESQHYEIDILLRLFNSVGRPVVGLPRPMINLEPVERTDGYSL